MEPLMMIGVVLFSIMAGAFGALMGLGGGLIIVPILMSVFGVEPKVAIAASIVSVIATSCTGSSIYCARGQVNIRLGILLETATVIGAITGALLTAVYLPKNAIMALFIGILIYAALYMRFHSEKIIPPTYSAKNAFCNSYYDEKSCCTVEYEPTGFAKGLGASFLAGNMSGMLGVGGGLIKVPAMNGMMNVPIKAAIATSTFMIGVTAAASAYIYYTNDWFNPLLTSFVAVGVFIGAWTGARMARKIHAVNLRNAFILVILLMAVLLIFKLIVEVGWL